MWDSALRPSREAWRAKVMHIPPAGARVRGVMHVACIGLRAAAGADRLVMQASCIKQEMCAGTGQICMARHRRRAARRAHDMPLKRMRKGGSPSVVTD
jgi:hypothetical protein